MAVILKQNVNFTHFYRVTHVCSLVILSEFTSRILTFFNSGYHDFTDFISIILFRPDQHFPICARECHSIYLFLREMMVIGLGTS